MDANTCTTCGKSTDVSSPEHCSGHESSVDDLKAALDAIPTPKLAETPQPKPAPVKEASPQPTLSAGAPGLTEQLNSIPTPGSSAPAKPPGENPAEVPEWQKKFASYQSSMTSSTPYTVPDGGYTSSSPGATSYQPPSSSGGYMIIAAFVVILAIAVLGIAMMKSVPPPVFDQPATTTSGSPATTTPSP